MHASVQVPCGNARSVKNRIASAITLQSRRLRRAANGGAADGEIAISSEGASEMEISSEGARLFELTAADLDDACTLADRAAAVFATHGSRSRGTEQRCDDAKTT